jgi:predicted dehydrogenase
MTQPQDNSRRDFLKTLGVTAAAASIPAAYVRQCFADDAPNPQPQTPKPKPPPVGEGLRIGLIGCGGQGTGDAQNATRLGAKIVAVCDLDSAHLADAKKKWPDAQTFHDFRDLLDRKEIDAVICGTPDHWHTLVAIAAMRAGKDIYCEKPLTLTIDEGKRLVKVQQETNRILQTGTQQRSSTYFRLACELVQNNRIGKLKHAEVFVPAGRREGPFKPAEIPSRFNYDMWLGQTPLVPYVRERTHLTFRYWWEYSAGTITDWGAHHNDIVLWATGNERSGPVSVEGKALVEPIPGGFTVPSQFEIHFTYANGVTHTCRTTTADEWNGQVLDPKGQRHGIRFEGSDAWIWVTRGTLTASDRELLKYKFSDADKRLYVSNDHMANFLECVKSRKETICPAEVGHRSASMCHLGAIAVRLGRKLQWDPAKEEFVGESEAQKWVAREMRRPWDYGAVL